ncbi:hypothetical protein K474DRAFT_1775365 [Panus rudis PR-1116 ss-1]|nr:hypothetical protein K474DRAFT_1775365 [Panus rudis PR-1116 ss-1]
MLPIDRFHDVLADLGLHVVDEGTSTPDCDDIPDEEKHRTLAAYPFKTRQFRAALTGILNIRRAQALAYQTHTHLLRYTNLLREEVDIVEEHDLVPGYRREVLVSYPAGTPPRSTRWWGAASTGWVRDQEVQRMEWFTEMKELRAETAKDELANM